MWEMWCLLAAVAEGMKTPPKPETGEKARLWEVSQPKRELLLCFFGELS